MRQSLWIVGWERCHCPYGAEVDEIIIDIEPRTPGASKLPRAGSVIPESSGARRRRHQAAEPTRRRPAGLIILVVAAMALVASWLGVWWAKSEGTRTVAVPTGSATASASSDFDVTTATTKDWTLYLRGLYESRAAALSTKNEALLESVYTADSAQRAADAATIAALRAGGGTLSGFEPELIAVATITRTAAEVVVEASDLIPAYEIVVLGGNRQDVPVRGENTVQITLRPVSGTWLINSVTRSPLS